VIGRIAHLGGFVTSIVTGALGLSASPVAEPKRVNVPKLEAPRRMYSAYCGPNGGLSRWRRAVRLCKANGLPIGNDPRHVNCAREATRRGVAYDKHRVRKSPMRTATGLLAFPR
jgi:hypothetical protein